MTFPFRSKKEIIYDILREEIVHGNYEPGSRLVIDDLAKKLNVSQIPIREAIQQLEADGFLTVEPYVGARIADIDATFIFEVFAILEAMEVICGRTACDSMTDEQLEKLTRMVEEMDHTIEFAEQWAEQNKAMHVFICECANTRLVMKIMEKTFYHWDRLRNYYLKNVDSTRREQAQAEHKRLLDALVKRSADEVETILRKHNQNALESYSRYMQAEGYLITTES